MWILSSAALPHNAGQGQLAALEPFRLKCGRAPVWIQVKMVIVRDDQVGIAVEQISCGVNTL